MKKNEVEKKRKRKADTEFVVTERCSLLDFLLLNLSAKSRNNVKSLLTHREVIVDGCVITQHDYTLNAGQIIKIIPPGDRGQAKKVKLDILYEDNDFIVINKQAGLLSIATDKEKEMTAYHLLTDYVQQSNPKGRIFSVHRLDRDTSGVLMVAKNERLKMTLQNNWADLVAERGYIAIVDGQLREKSGRIRSWLKETKTHLVYSSRKPGYGQEAITNYQVINECKDYSLLNIQLETGRKNQIRVHMKDIGHAVIGDKMYGTGSNPLKRLGLHAYKLEFKHPFTNRIMCFETEMPKDFKALFKGSNKNTNK